MTKAIIIKKQGGPEVLELSDISLGKPGPDQIKVKNIAIGLNYIDTYHRSGLYPLSLPSGIGLEGAGKIIEIGSNVKDLSVGDNVSYAGGMAFIYDPENKFEDFVNPTSIIWQSIETDYWKNFLKENLQDFVKETNSKIAEKIINNFEKELFNFKQICPIEMLDKLENPITLKSIVKKVS